MRGSCAGASTVGRCAVDSLPDARGSGEPPQLGGVTEGSCMRHASHEPYTVTPHHTQSLKVQRATLSASARQQQQRHVCYTCVTLTWTRLSTMHPQVQPDGGHDVRGSCAGASTVGRCAVGSLPPTRGSGEPPQLGGDSCMRHGSHEPYTHHITHSYLKVQRATLSASARQQQQRHVCCTCVTLT